MSYNKRVIILLVCVAMTMVLGLSEAFSFQEKELESEESLRSLYERWCRHHDIAREANEKETRFNVFKEEAKRVHMVNNQMDKPYKIGLNKFSDMTSHEFRSMYGGSKNSNHRMLAGASINNRSFRFAMTFAPSYVDWRNHGGVSPVKDQGRCDCSWAFSATGAVESMYLLKTGKFASFSEQQLLDCDINQKPGGCLGGDTITAFDYISWNGILWNEDYPYEGATNKTCSIPNVKRERKLFILGYEVVPKNDEDALLRAVANRPVSVVIDATGGNLRAYTEGIFSDSSCSNETVNHSLLLVGYGSENGQKYWLAKNSWGKNWGDNGFFKLLRGENMCGVASLASYVKF